MISVSQITKAFNGRVLFEEASLQVSRGERLGLVGPNGAGKSTLFSLILGHDEPDNGSVSIQRGVTIGFLPQETAPSEDETVLELAMAVAPELEEALRMLRIHPNEESLEHQEAMETFLNFDGYSLEAKAKRMLAGLAFRESDFDQPARTMSGGWIMRAHLARLLVMEPDLLMLDEPTNHLDLESLGWFQSHLRNYSGAILAISHDREFLNAICREILEIGRGRLNRYRGNYQDYIRQKQAREEQQLAAYKKQQQEIQHLQEFVDRFRAKASKAAQAQDRLKRLEKMERLEAPDSPAATMRFTFPKPEKSGQRVMILKNVRQAYGDHVVYEKLDLAIERGQRTVLVGPNGSGKSTLLKILAGQVPIQGGERELGYNTTTGYFVQQRLEMLNPEHTLLEEVMDVPKPVSEQSARSLLGSFLFSGSDAFKRVGVLSGGEKSRLGLAKLLLMAPNFLLLDEPTTHLDMPSIDMLIHALQQYEGTLLFVSHDVHFIRSIAKTVLHIDNGALTAYAGDYDYYLEKSKAGSAREALVAKLNNHRPNEEKNAPIVEPGAQKVGLKELRDQKKAQAALRQSQAREQRDLETRVHQLEANVLRLEERQKNLVATLADANTYADSEQMVKLNQELAAVTSALEEANGAWLQATERLMAGDMPSLSA